MTAPAIDCDRSDLRPNWSILLESGEGENRSLIQWVGHAESEAEAIEVAAGVARMTRAITKALTGREQRPIDTLINCCDGEDVPPSLTVSRPATPCKDAPAVAKLVVEAAAAALVCALKGAQGKGSYEVTVGVSQRWGHKAPYAVEIKGDAVTGNTYPQMAEPLRNALMGLAIAGVIVGQPRPETGPLMPPSQSDGAANRETVASLLRRIGLPVEADAFANAYGD